MSTHPSTDTGRRVLVLAYYFPPMGLSGVQRIAKLVKYLPEHGWTPTVVTAEPGGYFAFDPDLAAEVEASGVAVHRSPSLDPTRLFRRGTAVGLPAERRRSILARLSQLLFVPDNKIGWMPGALRTARRLMAGQSFDAILSTAPPYTSHLVGARLAREFDVPLVLDFRDDWLENPRHDYPTSWHRRRHARQESAVVGAARAVTTINSTIADALARRHPQAVRPDVLPQGFDPEDYAPIHPAKDRTRFTLIYTGVFYDAQRPDDFLEAMARVAAREPAFAREARARFVGLFPDAARARIPELNLGDIVEIGAYVTHREAMAEVTRSDVAWLVVGRRPGAEQISTGKLYAYMGARTPILALVPDGAAREALRGYGAGICVPPDDVEAIAGAIETLFEQWRSGDLPEPDESYVARFDRRRLAGQMAEVLSGLDRERDRKTAGS